MHIFTRRPRLLASVAVLALTAPMAAAHAQQEDEVPAAVAPVVTVTATRIEQPVDRVPAAVTVIDREQIEEHAYSSFADALEAVPGLTVVRTGGLGSTTRVQMRGTSSSNTLVLIDGMPVNDPASQNAFDFGPDLLGDVERIEVVRGPGAALYGNNAAGGVINIVTRRGEGPARVYGSVAAGNRGRAEGAAGVSGASGGFDYNLTVQGLTADGFNFTPARRLPNVGEADGFESRAITASAGYDFSDAARVDGSIRFRQSDSEIDDGGADDPDRINEADQLIWRLGGEVRPFGEALTTRLDIGQSIIDRTDEDAPDANDPTLTDDRFDSRRSYADLQNTYEAGAVAGFDDLTLVAGVTAERESIDVESFGSIHETEDTLSVYAQAQGRMFEALELTLAGRFADRENFDSRATWRLGALWTADRTGTRLRGSVGTAYRAPTLDERFAPFGNPDLEAETSTSWEIGVEQDLRLAGRARFATLGATYFQTDIDDKIGYDFATSTTRNISEAEIDGVEAFATVRPGDWLEATLSWTWTQTRDLLTGEPLPRVPRHELSLSATARPTEAWSISPEVIYATRQWDYVYPDGSDFGANGYNDGYTVVNLATTYRLTGNHQLFGRIDNLLDRDYELPNGYRAPGLTALAGLRISY